MKIKLYEFMYHLNFLILYLMTILIIYKNYSFKNLSRNSNFKFNTITDAINSYEHTHVFGVDKSGSVHKN